MRCANYDIDPCMHCKRERQQFCYMNQLDYKLHNSYDNVKSFILFSLKHPTTRASRYSEWFNYMKHLRLVIQKRKPEYLDMFDKLSILQ